MACSLPKCVTFAQRLTAARSARGSRARFRCACARTIVPGALPLQRDLFCVSDPFSGSADHERFSALPRAWRPSVSRFAARCASIPAHARFTPPTHRITASCRSASSFRATRQTLRSTSCVPLCWCRRSSARRGNQPRRQCVNVAVVFDYSRHMNALNSIDPDAKLARVEPGIVLDRLRDAAELHHLTYAPD